MLRYKAFLFNYNIIINKYNSVANGLDDFLAAATDKGVKIAVGSPAGKDSIDVLLKGLGIREYIEAIVNTCDVETWLQCIRELGVSPADCLVFENSPEGAQSALDADMNCIILTTSHITEEFEEYKNVIGYIDDFSAVKYYLLEEGEVG